MLGLRYHLATLLALILIVTFSAHIFTNAILKNTKMMKNMKKIKFYISGKIGEEVPSPETLAKFKAAEDMLKGKGFDVFNPTTSGLGAHAESLARKNGTNFYEEILLLDLQELKKCDAIYMLSDWVQSPGALIETNYAIAIGIKRYWQEDLFARMFSNESEDWRDFWIPLE